MKTFISNSWSVLDEHLGSAGGHSMANINGSMEKNKFGNFLNIQYGWMIKVRELL